MRNCIFFSFVGDPLRPPPQKKMPGIGTGRDTSRVHRAGRASGEADREDGRRRDQAQEDDRGGGQATDAGARLPRTSHPRAAAQHVRRPHVPRRRHPRSR